MEWAARYFDGIRAQPRAVGVRIDRDGIVLFEGGRTLAVWLPEDVRYAGELGASIQLRRSHGGERLVLPAEARPSVNHHCRRLRAGNGGAWQRWRATVIAFAIALAMAVLFFLVIVPIAAETFARWIPPAFENRIGAAAEAEITRALVSREKAPFCEAPAGAAALDALAARLGQAAARSVPIRVRVVDTNFANAAALPGGRILLFRGLIEKANGPAEVAGVLAHEMGHVAYRHVLILLVEQAAVSVFLGLLIGDIAGATVIAAVATMAASARYSQPMEAAADAFAIEVLNRAGIGAAPLADFFERVGKAETALPAIFSLLSSHPRSDERAARIRATGTGSAPAMGDEDWAALRKICG